MMNAICYKHAKKNIHSYVQASTGFIQKDFVRFGFTCNQLSTTLLFKMCVSVCVCICARLHCVNDRSDTKCKLYHGH